jgi:hypothetical protein
VTTTAANANTNPEHELCERWAHWVTTRKFYAPPPLGAGILAKLSAKTRATQPGGPDAELSADLWALNMAITAQPMDMRRRVFELYYRHRVKYIEEVAAELGISKATFYRYRKIFANHVVAARHAVIQAQKDAAASENCLID